MLKNLNLNQTDDLFKTNSMLFSNSKMPVYSSLNNFIYKLVCGYLLALPLVVWMPYYDILPDYTLWAFELIPILMILAIVFFSNRKKAFNTYGLRIIIIFLVTAFISMLYNGVNIIPCLLSLRKFIPYYLLFLTLININMDDNRLRKLVKIVFVIFILQIPIAVIKWLTIGRGEMPLGLIGSSTSTYITLFGVAFTIAYYLAYPSMRRLLFLCMAFVGVGLVGGKRAILFFIPVVLLIPVCFLNGRLKLILRYLLIFVCIVGISSYISVRLLPTLNPDQEVWGAFDLEYAVNYAVLYSSYEGKMGPTGRFGANIAVFEKLKTDGLMTFVLGEGPGYLLKSRFSEYSQNEAIIERSTVEYGINGLNSLALEYGYAGAAIWFLLYILIFRTAVTCLHGERIHFWRAFALGMISCCFIMSVIAYYYSPAYSAPTIAPFFFSLAAVTYHRWEVLKLPNTVETESKS